jgi:hypothetical protein
MRLQAQKHNRNPGSSIAQIAEILFCGLVEDEKELLAWQQHADIIDILRMDSPSEADLSELESLTLKWRKLMVQLYGGVVEQQQYKRKGKKQKKQRKKKSDSTVKARQHQAAVASSSQAGRIKEEEGENREEDHGNHNAEEEGMGTSASAKEKPLSFSFPNFKSCTHWGGQIQFLSPVWFQVHPVVLLSLLPLMLMWCGMWHMYYRILHSMNRDISQPSESASGRTSKKMNVMC